MYYVQYILQYTQKPLKFEWKKEANQIRKTNATSSNQYLISEQLARTRLRRICHKAANKNRKGQRYLINKWLVSSKVHTIQGEWGGWRGRSVPWTQIKCWYTNLSPLCRFCLLCSMVFFFRLVFSHSKYVKSWIRKRMGMLSSATNGTFDTYIHAGAWAYTH